jgi:hypothetical protein
MAFFSMLLSACEGSHNEINGTAPMYKVSEATGLYSALEIDAEQIAALAQGAVLVPADDNTTLFCDTFVDAGMKYAPKVSRDRSDGWFCKCYEKINKALLHCCSNKMNALTGFLLLVARVGLNHDQGSPSPTTKLPSGANISIDYFICQRHIKRSGRGVQSLLTLAAKSGDFALLKQYLIATQ